MHTTTARFDAEMWADLKSRCTVLNIATADYIRVATAQRLERDRYERRIVALELRVERIAQVIERVVRRGRFATEGRR